MGCAAHGGNAGTEVADGHGGQPHVLPDQRDQLRIQLAAAVEPELWKLQPFLKDLGRIGGEGSQDLAANLRPVRHRDAEGDHFIAGEDGHDERDVGRMRSSAIRAISHEDITGTHSCDRVPGENRFHLRPERAGEEAETVVLGDDPRLSVGDAAGEVEHFVHNGTHARPGQDDTHFASNGEQLVADDLACKGIRAGGAIGLDRMHDGPSECLIGVTMQLGRSPARVAIRANLSQRGR